MKNSTGLLNNLAWKFSERILSQAIGIIIGIVLARLLDPKDYGLVGMVTVFISLSYVFVDGGFNESLIQKKDADVLDFSTVFYFSLALSVILYICLFFCAPIISRFYGDDYKELTPILRVVGLQIIIYSMNAVQHAYVAKHMMFKKFFVATLCATLISGATGLYLAYTGYGVWALVWQGMTSSIIGLIALYFATKKLPKFMFSFDRLKKLFKFGANILGGNILIKIYTEIRSLIIGKIYSPQDLAFYSKGRVYPNLIVSNINSSIGAVLYPKIASVNNSMEQVKSMTRNSIRFSSYIMMPIMLTLAIVAEPFIRILITEKWIACVPLLQLFCIVYVFQPIHTANTQAIKAIGRSDICLKLEIIKKTIELVSLLCVMWISVKAIVINMAACSILFNFINAYPNRTLLNYSYKEQFKDISGALLLTLPAILIAYFLKYIVSNDWILLSSQCVLSISIYLALSAITKNKEFSYIFQLIKNRIKK